MEEKGCRSGHRGQRQSLSEDVVHRSHVDREDAPLIGLGEILINQLALQTRYCNCQCCPLCVAETRDPF